MSREVGVSVYLEAGRRRTFACALDWPGWCRSGKDEAGALGALAASAARYAVIAGEAGVPFSTEPVANFEVVEWIAGGATTDFGAPEKMAAADAQPLLADEAARMAALLDA